MTNEETIARFISDRIKQAREAKGLSQSDLGEVISKTKVTISDMERGKVGVSAVDLSLIAKKLGQPLNYFFPKMAIVRIAKDELNVKETQLVEAFRAFENYEIEDLVLNFVAGLATFSRKGPWRKLADDAVELLKIGRSEK